MLSGKPPFCGQEVLNLLQITHYLEMKDDDKVVGVNQSRSRVNSSKFVGFFVFRETCVLIN